jgi:hypothetical protein
MKTGRPAYHIPSAETVSRDVKRVFVEARKHIAEMLKVWYSASHLYLSSYSPMNLQAYEGALNFATDAWTSPNHKVYIFTVHFEHEGSPMSMLLDLVEVPMSHSGTNLAKAFAKVLEEFGIEDKVSSTLHNQILVDLLVSCLLRSSASPVITHQTTTP